jgi:hypothetical protein
LIDLGAEDQIPVLVTVALRVYAFPAKFSRVKVVEAGATDAAAQLNCFTY